jgi:hypothetical protein
MKYDVIEERVLWTISVTMKSLKRNAAAGKCIRGIYAG